MNNLNSPIIFDVGAHRGDDTYIYLKQGFNVLAVEANPVLVAYMNVRFANEIGNGRLIVINAAVHTTEEKYIPFFITPDDSRSSIRAEDYQETIMVRTTKLKYLINKFGMPQYCKIDIENADILALDSLDQSQVPNTISVEISGDTIGFLSSNEGLIFKTIDKLAALGYKRFKLVDQEDMIVLETTSHYPPKGRVINRIKMRLFKLFLKNNRRRILSQFKLAKNSEISGPIPENLEGEWRSYVQIKKLALYHFREYAAMTSDTKMIFWVDVYAKL